MATSVALRRAGRDLPWLLLLRVAALAAGVYGAVVFVLAPLTGHFGGEFEDFGAYLGAARAVMSHTDIYAAFTQQQQNVALSGFDYPPAVALLVAPLALVPAHTAALLWLLLTVAATFAGALVVARTVLPASWPRLELAMLATFVDAPATYNMWHGQMNPVVFLLLALALRAWMRGRQTWCGVLIGAAAAIKLAPIVLVLLLLRRRWRRGAVAALATGAASVVVGVAAFGIATTSTYVRSVLPVLSRLDGWLYNQSIAGIVSRASDHSVLTFQPDPLWLRAISLALAVAAVVAAAWCVRVHTAVRARRAAEFACGVLAMLLAGTLTWYAQDVHLLIALAGVAALASVVATRRALVAAASATLVATAVLAPMAIAAATMPALAAASRSWLWWPLLQLASLPALASAALLVVLVLRLRHPDAGLVEEPRRVVDSKCELRNSHFRTAPPAAARVP